MQSSINSCEGSHNSLGKRRGKSDLDCFSIDLSRKGAAQEGHRTASYPSPPMSGSPSYPAYITPIPADRSRGGFGRPPQDVSSGLQTPQPDSRRESRPSSVAYFQTGAQPPANLSPRHHSQGQPQQPPSYPPYQGIVGRPLEPGQYQYSAPPPPTQPPAQAQPMSTMAVYTPHEPRDPFYSPSHDRQQPESTSDHSPRGAQRKPKGHVAAACVPCKRAHLRCDNARPCSRCLTTGKEDSCIDTQHKKRGRPRLRDEREARYEGMTPYSTPIDLGMRRPMSMYASSTGGEMAMHDSSLQRSGSYRVLKSQTTSSAPRHIDYASPMDANVYGSSPGYPVRPMSSPAEIPCAYLTVDLHIARVTRSFEDATGLQRVAGAQLMNVVAPEDREKVYRLQRSLDDERQYREPNYLPPIYGRAEQDRLLQTIGITPEDVSRFRTDREELLSFRSVDSRSPRTYQVRFGLHKMESTYFVVMIIVVSTTPTGPPSVTQHTMPSPYTRDAPKPYGYSPAPPAPSYAAPPPQTSYGQYQPQPYDPRAREQPLPTRYRPQEMGPGPAPLPSYAQPFEASRDGQRMPMAPDQRHSQSQQSEFQLPPIRLSPTAVREERSNRLDIGGLLEDPNKAHRGLSSRR